RRKTERDLAHLTGPVQTVRSTTAQWRADQHGARVEEAPRLESLSTYDRNGHLSEIVYGSASQDLATRVVFRYDGQGLKYEAAGYSASGTLLYTSWYSYTYDARESHRDDPLVQ